MKIWGPNKNKESQKKNLVEPSLLSNNFVLKHTLVLRFFAVVNFVIDIMPKKKYETNNLPAPELLYAYSAILGERRKEIETVANNFFNINTTNNHRKRHNI
jgi:hypothetical protein